MSETMTREPIPDHRSCAGESIKYLVMPITEHHATLNPQHDIAEHVYRYALNTNQTRLIHDWPRCRLEHALTLGIEQIYCRLQQHSL